MLVVTNDGRTLLVSGVAVWGGAWAVVLSWPSQGTLKALDQMVNLVLADPKERIVSQEGCTEADLHGVFLVRGDTVALVGEVDDVADAEMDWGSVRAEPMEPLHH